MSTQFERTGNPFPGLRPFDTDEYNLFFGRDGQSDELLARLARTRFLAVVGTSGSGKSSLIRAGLIPALYGGLMAQTGSAWRIALMRPGSDPIGNLACALSRDDVIGSSETDDEVQAAIIETTLRRSTLGLVDAVRQARLASYENVLVCVDQFEELFRFRSMREVVGSEDDAAAFVKLLLEAPRERDANIYVVLTMRSDFLGDCAQFWGLPEAINEGQYLIPRMTRDERRSAITGPALVADAEISAPLVNRLLNDAGDSPDQLPILQHALMRTWEHWTAHRRDSEPVGLEDYEAVGTMSDALSRHAEEAYAELTDERSQTVAACMFKALTERGADSRETRRPTRLSDICAITGAGEDEVRAIIEVFRREGRSFLMPPAGTPLAADTVIDISHESLIRNWQRLKDWARDEAEAARIYRRLAGAASDYRAGEVGLLDDVTLQWVLKWKETYRPNRAWGVRYHPEYDAALGYLEESRAASAAAAEERERRAQAELERERREREQAEAFAAEQQRAAQRTRRMSRALFVALTLALAAMLFAFAAMRQARASERQAQEDKKRAQGAESVAEQQRREVAAALEETKAAKHDAEVSRDDANKQAGIAEQEKSKAEDEKKRADAAAEQARQQAGAALEAKRQALEAERVAEGRARALEANGKFRDATILAERGDFDRAAEMYDAAIKGLQTNGVKDTEGVADTYVQIGQTHFGAIRTPEDKSPTLTDRANYDRVTRAVESYDKAVKHYEEAGVGTKAADALLSVGETLLNVARDVPVGRNITRAGDELDNLNPESDFAVNDYTVSPDEMEGVKVSLKNQALERYKQAYLHYREAGNEDGMMRAAYLIGKFYQRDELPAWQDKTPTLDIALCNGPAREYVSNTRKALCYFKELERLSLSPRLNRKDLDIQRLLVWIGGINFELGDKASAESYFGRAQLAFLSLPDNRTGEKMPMGRRWSKTAETAEDAGLHRAALELYGRALEAYKRAGNNSGEALAFFRMGVVTQKMGKDQPGVTPRVLEMFRNAVAAYRRNVKADDNQADGIQSDEFFAIGSFAEENYDEGLALDAYNLALSRGEAWGDEIVQARALSGIASVQTQASPDEARRSYMRSFALYSKVRDGVVKNYDVAAGDEYLKELERISAAVTSLDREIKAKALAGHTPQTADTLCPFPIIAYAQPNATAGDTVTFSAYAVYPEWSKLRYEWTFNSPAAKIVATPEGPYPSVSVSTDGVGEGDLTATLLVDDGSGGACRQTAHATTKVKARPRIPVK